MEILFLLFNYPKKKSFHIFILLYCSVVHQIYVYWSTFECDRYFLSLDGLDSSCLFQGGNCI
jgi:hypothetical protein